MAAHAARAIGSQPRREIRAAGNSAALRTLADLVERGASPSAVADAFAAAAGDLVAFGVEPAMTAAIRQGLTRGDWEEAAASFGDAFDGKAAFYLGPMRCREGRKLGTGLLLLRRDEAGRAVARQIERNLASLGARLFGTPCRFRGRRMEFYRVLLAAGGATDPADPPIALFAPFYLGGWSDRARQIERRRTLLFGDVVWARFAGATVPAARSRLLLDGRPPLFLDVAGTADCRRGVALWLALHELLHANGPLPLFGAPVRKLELGCECWAMEEMRVDMTAWLLLHELGDLFGPAANLAADIILADRLLRLASMPAAAAARDSSRRVQREQGDLWRGALLCHGALREAGNGGGLAICRERAYAAIHDVVRRVYAVEDAARADPERGRRLFPREMSEVRSALLAAAERA
jgi:hypothetical protein